MVHPRVPFVSYPFEWTFSMLKDAALLQLDLTRAALADGVSLKDATPYNVQFIGARPQFIDAGSFEVRRKGDPWYGYKQFCEMFLYPLMLQAHLGVGFQPFLRGSVNGITPETMAKLFPGSIRRPRKGRLTHVVLHAAITLIMLGFLFARAVTGYTSHGRIGEARVRPVGLLEVIRELGIGTARMRDGPVQLRGERHIEILGSGKSRPECTKKRALARVDAALPGPGSLAGYHAVCAA